MTMLNYHIDAYYVLKYNHTYNEHIKYRNRKNRDNEEMNRI